MANHPHAGQCRHFLTYTGIKLPLNLTTPLQEADLANRNTYFRAYYDAQDRNRRRSQDHVLRRTTGITPQRIAHATRGAEKVLRPSSG